jgi:hypothetical protein
MGETKVETEFIVMTASAKMPSSVRAPYKKVAVVEVEKGVVPKMISERAKGVVRIVHLADKLHARGVNTAYTRAVAEANELAASLNISLA